MARACEIDPIWQHLFTDSAKFGPCGMRTRRPRPNEHFDVILNLLFISSSLSSSVCTMYLPLNRHTHAQTHALTHARTHAHIHTRTHAHTHTYIHTWRSLPDLLHIWDDLVPAQILHVVPLRSMWLTLLACSSVFSLHDDPSPHGSGSRTRKLRLHYGNFV